MAKQPVGGPTSNQGQSQAAHFGSLLVGAASPSLFTDGVRLSSGGVGSDGGVGPGIWHIIGPQCNFIK